MDQVLKPKYFLSIWYNKRELEDQKIRLVRTFGGKQSRHPESI